MQFNIRKSCMMRRGISALQDDCQLIPDQSHDNLCTRDEKSLVLPAH